MVKMGWSGQFNLDVLFMLSSSALWTAWRNQFTPAGLLLGLLAFFFGAPFLAIYVTVVSVRAKGDMRMVLLGPDRAAQLPG